MSGGRQPYEEYSVYIGEVGTQKQFWYVKRRKNDYLILVLKSHFYSRIVLEIENSKELIQQINDKLGLQ